MKRAEIFVNKMSAAKRQIDAAIRMKLRNEDNLAIYTVASAGFRILHDLLAKKGQDFSENNWRDTLITVAQWHLSGKDYDKFENFVLYFPECKHIVLKISDIIKDMDKNSHRARLTDVVSISLPLGDRQAYVGQFTRPANFLKHADRDHRHIQNEENFEPTMVIRHSCELYFDMIGTYSPEMLVFATLFIINQEDSSENLPGPMKLVGRILEKSSGKRRLTAAKKLIEMPTPRKAIIEMLDLFGRAENKGGDNVVSFPGA